MLHEGLSPDVARKSIQANRGDIEFAFIGRQTILAAPQDVLAVMTMMRLSSIPILPHMTPLLLTLSGALKIGHIVTSGKKIAAPGAKKPGRKAKAADMRST